MKTPNRLLLAFLLLLITACSGVGSNYTTIGLERSGSIYQIYRNAVLNGDSGELITVQVYYRFEEMNGRVKACGYYVNPEDDSLAFRYFNQIFEQADMIVDGDVLGKAGFLKIKRRAHGGWYDHEALCVLYDSPWRESYVGGPIRIKGPFNLRVL